MSDSQKFPVAAHALAYLAHKSAMSADRVGVQGTRRELIATRAGANGGAWLLRPADQIRLDEVLKAVDGCTHLGRATLGVEGCPVGEQIPDRIRDAIQAADAAAIGRLSQITVADLLRA